MEFPDPENLGHKNFQPTTDQLAPCLLDDAIRINESVARIFFLQFIRIRGDLRVERDCIFLEIRGSIRGRV